MSSEPDSREEIEALIREAFDGVELGDGVSLRQAELIDRMMSEEISDRELLEAKLQDVVDDWTEIPFSDLERDCVAHLDANGLRYYLPALMLSVLEDYESTSMRVIGTIMALCPTHGDFYDYTVSRYSELSRKQKHAIARFMQALPTLLPLSKGHRRKVPRATSEYWQEYL